VLLATGALAFASAAALAVAPTIAQESFSNVGSDSATVSAQINAQGVPTTYRVEYGTSTKYGSSTPEPEASVGAPQEAVGELTNLTGLRANTVYHARFVATNANNETTVGGDISFTTVSSVGGTTSILPDGRAYELVSSGANGSNGQVYVPFTQFGRGVPFEIQTSRPVRASADGKRVAYVAESLSSAGGTGNVGNGGGTDFLATRSADDWATVQTDPPARVAENTNAVEMLSFSPDLSVGFFSQGTPLPGAPECPVLYSRTASGGAERAAYVECGEPNYTAPEFAGASADGSRVFFQRAAALPEAAPAAPSVGETEDNLYESVAGRLTLINVLPSGVPEGKATFGGPLPPESFRYWPNFNHVVSTDGSRVFWTDLKNNDLYVRENSGTPEAKSVLVSEGGEYWTASADGSKAFFTKAGDLYVFDVNTEQTTALTEGGKAQGVVGASEDGSYVYFVAEAALGEDNLYLRHYDGVKWSAPMFVATLSPADNAFTGSEQNKLAGDWLAGLKSRTAEVTPDGRHLVFLSRQSLTPYPNEGVPEVYLYDAGTGRIWCASCNPSGARPVAVGSYLGPSLSNNYMIRWISDDGGRVFFDSSEPLVPQDTNGVQDVYEWERDGTGSCRQAAGCIYLISGSLSSDESELIDASASGDDVFFTTRGQLVPRDRNEKVDLYDARVNGGFPESSLACTGTGCQGVPPAPPVFATPASMTFSGLGNFPPQPPGKPKGCRKGFVKRHGECVKQKRGRRKHAAGKHRGGKAGNRSTKGRK
jgi:Tol biopolymer transport system component